MQEPGSQVLRQLPCGTGECLESLVDHLVRREWDAGERKWGRCADVSPPLLGTYATGPAIVGMLLGFLREMICI